MPGVLAGVFALAPVACGELLGIDTIDYAPPRGHPAGDAGDDHDAAGPPPETLKAKECNDEDLCGDAGASCCESRLVAGSELGDYAMGCDFAAGTMPCIEPWEPEHPARVGDFYLDTFEVTVGRFRQFVEDYNLWRANGNPAPGAGRHPRIDASGWRPEWDTELPKDSAWFEVDLRCSTGFEAWDVNADPRRAQNCLNWPTAFAFCIWSGGRLPTEAEWEMAATGAGDNRVYPWGDAKPTPEYAVYNAAQEYPPTSFWLANAGAHPKGIGRFGHFDLAGNVAEWTLDQYSDTWYAPGGAGNPCDDCANLGDVLDAHVVRGGSWNWDDQSLLSAGRDDDYGVTTPSSDRLGVRCARDGAP